LVSGLLSLLCHVLLEPAATLSARDWLLIAGGHGPGAAGRGVLPVGPPRSSWVMPRKIGILSLHHAAGCPPRCCWLSKVNRAFSWSIVALAAVMIIGAAVLGTRGR
jgi:hypothetical protein